MKIVVLDGYTLNPGDQRWDALQALGDCTIHPRTPANEIVSRAQGAEVVLTNKVPLTRDTFAALPGLRYVGVLATGFNIVDIAAAREHGVVVTNVPTYGTRSVAQLTFALILELAHRVGSHAASVRQGDWSQSADFSYWNGPLVELEGKILGIVGPGRIGRAVADLGRAFGMEVLLAGRTESASSSSPAAPQPQRVTIEQLFRRSDIVSLHCPLTDATRHLVSAERLSWMKPGAWLINTSRGPLLDESAVATALREGRLGAAALDVLSVEPPPADHPLVSAPNCWITPHIAWATLAARQRLMQVAVENLRAFLAGSPENVVNR